MRPINYAHRGASAYAPENTFAAFYLGWEMGANGIETDVQATRDGVLVLFHDDTLMRIANRPESIRELTYKELLQIDVGRHRGEKFIGECIPTLEEFLRYFSRKKLHFSLEIKCGGIERELVSEVRRNVCANKTIVTSFLWDPLLAVRRLDSGIHTGYLCKKTDQALLERMKSAGIDQYCPKASELTPEWNEAFRAAGFSIRAWGVENERLMHQMLDLHVDGMTVNFPDKLEAALKKRVG